MDSYVVLGGLGDIRVRLLMGSYVVLGGQVSKLGQ